MLRKVFIESGFRCSVVGFVSVVLGVVVFLALLLFLSLKLRLYNFEAPLGVIGIRDIQGKSYRDTGYCRLIIKIRDIIRFQNNIFRTFCRILDHY